MLKELKALGKITAVSKRTSSSQGEEFDLLIVVEVHQDAASWINEITLTRVCHCWPAPANHHPLLSSILFTLLSIGIIKVHKTRSWSSEIYPKGCFGSGGYSCIRSRTFLPCSRSNSTGKSLTTGPVPNCTTFWPSRIPRTNLLYNPLRDITFPNYYSPRKMGLLLTLLDPATSGRVIFFLLWHGNVEHNRYACHAFPGIAQAATIFV